MHVLQLDGTGEYILEARSLDANAATSELAGRNIISEFMKSQFNIEDLQANDIHSLNYEGENSMAANNTFIKLSEAQFNNINNQTKS